MEKVSHEAAMQAVSLWSMDWSTNAHLEAQRDGRNLLRAYIAQQQASEAAAPSQPAESPPVPVEPLYVALAYLTAEVAQYRSSNRAPSRIRRAKELLESALPPEPTNGR